MSSRLKLYKEKGFLEGTGENFQKKGRMGKMGCTIERPPPVSFLLGLIQCTESQVKNHPYQFIPLISKGKKITKMSQKISSDITETPEVLRLTISVEFMAE